MEMGSYNLFFTEEDYILKLHEIITFIYDKKVWIVLCMDQCEAYMKSVIRHEVSKIARK